MYFFHPCLPVFNALAIGISEREVMQGYCKRNISGCGNRENVPEMGSMRQH